MTKAQSTLDEFLSQAPATLVVSETRQVTDWRIALAATATAL